MVRFRKVVRLFSFCQNPADFLSNDINSTGFPVDKVARLNTHLHRSFFAPWLTVETIFVIRDARPA